MKVRLAVKNKSVWSQIRQDIQMKKHLDFEFDDDSILVDTEEEVEFDHKYNQEETKLLQTIYKNINK